MTTFEFSPRGATEKRARALLMHVEGAAEREGLDYPIEAQHMADILKRLDATRCRNNEEALKALALDPDYEVAMFDLGGVHWNNGDFAQAKDVWNAAVDRFPNHDLSVKVQRDFPFLFFDK